MEVAPDVTLNFNLSIADIGYARKTLPILVDTHRSSVLRVTAVVDCCKRERTGRFQSQEDFDERLELIIAIANELKTSGYLDEIHLVKKNSDLRNRIQRKYFSDVIGETHDAGGAALLTYAAGIELATTRYLLQFDSDMLIYQEKGYDWVKEGLALMNSNADIVGVTPRISPPFVGPGSRDDAPSLHEGRPNYSVPGGWLNDWVSLRCFLLDRSRLEKLLPLISGLESVKTRIRKLFDREYPQALEKMISVVFTRKKKWTLNLSSGKAWLLHPPPPKEEWFANNIERIQHQIEKNRFPSAQRGRADINYKEWRNYLDQNVLT